MKTANGGSCTTILLSRFSKTIGHGFARILPDQHNYNSSILDPWKFVKIRGDFAFQYDFQKKYTVIPAPTSTTNIRIHDCGIFCA